MLVAIAGAAAAGPYDDALAALKRGDYATEYRLLRPLADQGNDMAQTFLGNMYLRGHGVPQDYAEAIKWFQRAADQDNAAAQLQLGFMYGNGYGVPQDYVQAHMWYNLAASRFNQALFEQERNKAVHSRDVAASRMTPAQIAEAQKLAREWKPKAKR
jgi:uncharacterized protein